VQEKMRGFIETHRWVGRQVTLGAEDGVVADHICKYRISDSVAQIQQLQTNLRKSCLLELPPSRLLGLSTSKSTWATYFQIFLNYLLPNLLGLPTSKYS